MPDKEEGRDLINSSPFNKLTDAITNNLNSLYQKTWFSTSDNKTNRESIFKDINTAIDNIMSNNLDISGEQNVSRLYRRLKSMQNDESTIQAFKNLFDDKNLMSSVFTSYSQNRYLYDYDAEIDVVLKYMPKLKEALSVLKDNVLSTDHFSKDFISAVNISDTANEDVFSKRLDELKKTYKLLENIEKWYSNTSTYGEEFVYIIPYSKGISQIMKDRDNFTTTRGTMNLEAMTYDFNGNSNRLPEKFNSISESTLKDFGTLTIELSHANAVTSIIEEFEKDNEQLRSINEQSMDAFFTEEFGSFFNEEEAPKKKDAEDKKPINIDDVDTAKDRTGNSRLKQLKNAKKFSKEKLLSDEDINKFIDNIEKDSTADDGLIDLNKRVEQKHGRNKYDIPGAIVKTLDRHNVIPVFIDEDICMGYYYFEFQEKRDFMINSSMRLSDPMMSVTNGNNFASENDQAEHDKALRYISSELSKYIDSNFIKRNQDLKKEIYAILKYNQIYNGSHSNKVKVTFIPPEDIHHIYFDLDPHTHRGRSDLHESMLPAKLFSAMYITASIMIMTRGYDKRVYYINPGIEANLTEAMMNVINQVKQGNFGIRQIRNNLNQVLNITGRFNDYFILKNPSGDSPLNMEVIQGQNVDVKTELMNMLEEMAINSSGVPIEIIQTRQNSMDYAIQLTMSNSKFLRLVFKRQGRANEVFSGILEKIYNYHFRKNDMITLTLPPPTFLSITNNTQYFEWDGDPNDEVGKVWFTKVLKKRCAGTYYNKDFVDEAKQKAKQLATLMPLPSQKQQ